ncbi:DUF202 domain-containing protein [Arthrobacter sp. 24S4-2]|nr:DUF202 domain-containing protein [Arthrobacter sp. 24S4-2]
MTARRDAATHGDSGLQPERTDLAWGRTTMAMVVAAAVFLRWLPHHGWFVGTLVAAATVTAHAINFTQKRLLPEVTVRKGAAGGPLIRWRRRPATPTPARPCRTCRQYP